MNESIYKKLTDVGVAVFTVTTAAMNITQNGIVPEVRNISYDIMMYDYNLPKVLKCLSSLELEEFFENQKNRENQITVFSYCNNTWGETLHLGKEEFLMGSRDTIHQTIKYANMRIKEIDTQVPKLIGFIESNPRKRKEKTQLKELTQKKYEWETILRKCNIALEV